MKTLLSFMFLSCVLFGQGETARIDFFTTGHPSYLNLTERTTISLAEESTPSDELGDITYTGWTEIEESYFDYNGFPLYSIYREVEEEQLGEFPNITHMYPTPCNEEDMGVFGFHFVIVSAAYRHANDPPTLPDRIITAVMPVNYPQ